MANSTVADLPAASALTGTEVLYADDGAADVKVTPTQIKTFALVSPVSIGANVAVSTTDIKIGNATANIFANSIILQVANSTSVLNIEPTTLNIGNATANLVANSVIVKVANSGGIANLQPTQLVIGTSTINSTVISTGTANLYINTTAVRVPNTGLITNTGATANGYTYLPGGILFQWGRIASNTTVGNITFPIAFPATLFSWGATASPMSNVYTSNAVVIIGSNTTTMNVRTALAAAAVNVTWWAIGN